ncbi:MAG: flagellar hook-basal body complex protein FliE [Clostridiales bacterium]|jgi:flagellar hook-basal body complex protein FliE|nr:flagellar hook-basal body complex protein FliE [Clostridiales bacterium]
MQFTSIQPIQLISDLTKTAGTQNTSGTENTLPFQDLLQDAVNNVKTTNADLTTELNNLATGQTDDLHNVTIASQKATLSVQLMVQLRNKALDAYNEIMRITV